MDESNTLDAIKQAEAAKAYHINLIRIHGHGRGSTIYAMDKTKRIKYINKKQNPIGHFKLNRKKS